MLKKKGDPVGCSLFQAQPATLLNSDRSCTKPARAICKQTFTQLNDGRRLPMAIMEIRRRFVTNAASRAPRVWGRWAL